MLKAYLYASIYMKSYRHRFFYVPKNSRFDKYWTTSTSFIEAYLYHKYLIDTIDTVVSYQNESFSLDWELPSLLSPSFITRGRMEARKAALILMKNSHFDRTPQYIDQPKVNWSSVLEIHEVQILYLVSISKTRFYKLPAEKTS